MFTLDRMTLFFFSLSESYRNTDSSEEDRSITITNWSSQVNNLNTRHDRKGKSGSNAPTPTLTSGTSRLSKPSTVLAISRTAQNNNVKIKEVDRGIVSDGEGAISERDERFGGERERAAGSPHKVSGQRATSSVCYQCYPQKLEPAYTGTQSLVKIKESANHRLTVPLKVTGTKKPVSNRSSISAVSMSSI